MKLISILRKLSLGKVSSSFCLPSRTQTQQTLTLKLLS